MINTEELKNLCEALCAIKDEKECENFLRDLCTATEIREMSRRITAAKMLHNNAQYLEVCAKTGLSTATISRVSRCLKDGDGYSAVIPRIAKKDE